MNKGVAENKLEIQTADKTMSDLIPINILIGDRTYRIKTLAKDEEVIRRTLKIINDKIIEYKTQFAGKDMQDYIAMVMIWYATEASSESNPALEKEITDALLKMEELLDKAL
jgi:Cell division protein ZapA